MVVNMVKFLMKRLQQKEKYLKSFGVTFMFSRVTYLHYYVVKCILAILLTCIFYRIGAWMAMVGLCIGFYIVDLIIHISNTSDNDNMLADIESIYDIMRIQARAGVYMQDSLMDCYSAARSPRLKAALLHMCNQLSTTGTIEEAILEFESRFSNRHVDVDRKSVV